MDCIQWAYVSPDKHQHRVSGMGFVDNEIDNELVLQCACGMTWHTGLAADDDYHDIRDLKTAAAKWLRDELLGKVTRRQLPLPLVVETVLYTPPKRRYTLPLVVDMSAQMALPLAA
jgi:hypothetical protein